jgi:dihydrofolate reductase
MEKSMSVNAILAVDDNLGIGFNNDLPWDHNKKDMQWFRQCTTGHVMIMGRNTWESFGSTPLPNRKNIVVTNRKVDGNPDMVLRGNIEKVIQKARDTYPDLHIFIIGGANLYRQALPYCDKLYISRIKGVYRCDTFMHGQDFKDFIMCDYVDAEDDKLIIKIMGRQ